MPFSEQFTKLKNLLSPYQKNLILVEDSDTSYYLDTAYIMPNKKPMFFAAVKINKTTVSFHLMPIYVFPELIDSLSSQLKKCLTGKSCFNFKQLDANLLKELKSLTKKCYEKYKEEGYI